MERVTFNGWKACVRLSNGSVEAVVTTEVGPRIVRFGFVGQANVFGEIEGQQGGRGESEWMIRGGHRLWVAPEEKPRTYELDNGPLEVEALEEGGVRTLQRPGPLSGLRKTMDIALAPDADRVRVVHKLHNESDKEATVAPWALSVMAQRGTAVIPLPDRIAHEDRVTHNQEWSLWGYTDLTDARWSLGTRYLRFRQDPQRGPNKLGLAQREGWAAYLLGETLFVKRFAWREGAAYPDGGVNFETFANEDFLELESLGPLVCLEPGAAVSHEETWELHAGVPACASEDDVDAHVRPLIEAG